MVFRSSARTADVTTSQNISLSPLLCKKEESKLMKHERGFMNGYITNLMVPYKYGNMAEQLSAFRGVCCN